jgi:hypothetical protein
MVADVAPARIATAYPSQTNWWSARQEGPGSQDAQEYSLAEQQDEVGGRLSSNGEGQVEGQRGEHHRGAAARQRH